ncbi:phosphatidylinositol-glycan biosynthesis class X protein isoform X1 [Ictalurus punctatus]|uniref:Phosphatidylinositol-glycan biosynthesis class X protein n=2 Tax=Ictalurus punctatus TaxID=7998 RepID=A0A2D0RVX8_ICTPU|nr:phosphatidylinositol-glycan biosynthesis class X protein isoform X1 [Ictalurus punctatus]
MLSLYFVVIGLCFIFSGASQEDGVGCGFTSSWLESVVMSMKLTKQGFHRDLVYEVRHEPTSHPVKTLLLHRLPNGVYMDQYQLADLREEMGLQVLLDSALDLEAPAHVSSAFSALVFLSPPEPLQAAVPVHGRYHKASSSGGWERVVIEPPRLLLRSEHCDTVNPGIPHRVVDAPCTVQNQTLCSWLEVHGLQVPSVSVKLPVGDSSLIIPVCAVTTLVSLLCSAFLFRAVWKHGIF